MTVRELIKELSKIDPELDVVYSHSEYGIVDINVATTSLHILEYGKPKVLVCEIG